jgi:hypothetical protein
MPLNQLLWSALLGVLGAFVVAFGWMPCPACCAGRTACCPDLAIPDTIHATVYWRQYFLGSVICDGNNTTFALTRQSSGGSQFWCGTWGGGTVPGSGGPCCYDSTHGGYLTLMVACRNPDGGGNRFMYQLVCGATGAPTACVPNESAWVDFTTTSCSGGTVSFVKTNGTVFVGSCCALSNDVGTTFLTVTL